MSASQCVADDVVQDEREDNAADDGPPKRIKRILHDRSPDDWGHRPGLIVCPKRRRLQGAPSAPRARSAFALDARLRAAAGEPDLDGLAQVERRAVDDDRAVGALDDAVAAREDARRIEVDEALRDARAARRGALDRRVC